MNYGDYENPKIQIISENCSLMVKVFAFQNMVYFVQQDVVCQNVICLEECNKKI